MHTLAEGEGGGGGGSDGILAGRNLGGRNTGSPPLPGRRWAHRGGGRVGKGTGTGGVPNRLISAGKCGSRLGRAKGGRSRTRSG